MLSEDLLRHLKSENELLQIQLQDLNYMIKIREEELDLLRVKANQAVALQSRLDINLDEFYQMQDQIGKEQDRADAAAQREISLESELLRSIEMETELYNMRDQFTSTKAALADANEEVNQMASVYKELANLKARIRELESNLEIASLETTYLKEEVDKYRQQEALNNTR